MTINYYQKQKERLQKEARKRYESPTEEEKEKKCNRKLSEVQKQKLVEYRGNYHLTHYK